MDHVLDGMQAHYDVYLELFCEDWRSGKYQTFNQVPYYEQLQILIKAMNVIRKYLDYPLLRLKNEVDFFLS